MAGLLQYAQDVFESHVQDVYDVFSDGDPCTWSPFFGAMGAALGLFFANAGAAYGLAISFKGYIRLGADKRVDNLMLIKGLVPGIMASVRGIYGMIIGILITSQLVSGYSVVKGFAHFYAGLCVGLSGLASGYCMGDIGEAGLKCVALRPKLFVSILLIIIFCEAIGLYGLIVSLILLGKDGPSCPAAT